MLVQKNRKKHIAVNISVFDEFPVLETRQLILRQFDVNDAQRLYEIRSQKSVMQYMDSYPEKSAQLARHKIKELNLSFELRLGISWAIELKSTEKMIGYIGIWKLDKENCRGEIGYALDPDYWRKGYMTEAFHSVINFGFQDLQLHSFEANVNPNNENSINILKKHGFRQEAYFHENYFFDGQFLDSMIFSLLEKNWTSNI